jgi:small nuclear ribonucleoprotein (snRNP)-like protein
MEKELSTTKYRNQGRSSDIVRALHQYIDKELLIKLKNKKIIQGKLQAYDEHMNLILNSAEDITEEKKEILDEIILRGSNIIMVSLPEISN